MKNYYCTPDVEILYTDDVVCTSGDGNSVTIPETDGWVEED